MHRWILRAAFGGLALWLLFAAWAQRELGSVAPAPRGEGAPRRVLILYEPTPERSTELSAIMAANLAGRFGRAELRPISGYRAGGGRGFDATFVLPAGAVPRALAADMAAPARPVVWIGARGGEGRVRDVVAVRYKGRDFQRDLRAAREIAVPAGGEVLATAIGVDSSETPWAVRTGNLVQIAEDPFDFAHEEDRYLVFADLLFGLLAPQTAERHRAMVRIDGVGPEANPRRIRALADLLHEEGIPFTIAVHPRYRDPEGVHNRGRAVRVDLGERPQLVQALSHALSRGATLVAQGLTHQSGQRRNPHQRVSGGDAEYFALDLVDGVLVQRGPLQRNGVDDWRGRFAEARRAWGDSGLPRPILFSAPLQAASVEAYAAAREDHAARYDRSLYFPGEADGGAPDYRRGSRFQFFPYEAVDIRGDFVIPENLGAPAEGRGPERLIEAAERNLAVRDGFASFAFPWQGEPEDLRAAVRGIAALGYRFVGPGEVIRDAPRHAGRALRRAPKLALVAAGWVGRLPPLTAPLLLALLALFFAGWLGSEWLVEQIGGPRNRARPLLPTGADLSGEGAPA